MAFLKKRLFTPGPTELLPEAQRPPVSIYHRSEEFKQIFLEAAAELAALFKTGRQVLILTSSGTGAMEAAVSNLLSPGDRAIAVAAGKFGERWVELCRAFQVEVEAIELPWGESVDPDEIEKRLARGRPARAVLLQACESSTGAANDIETIGRIVARYPETCLVVDAITGIGAMPVEADAWGLDVVIAGSQKAFMMPPGLAFIALSEKAWRAVERGRSPRYYFDLLREREMQRSGETGFTPAISLVQSLHAALGRIKAAGGVDQLVRNAHLQASATRAAARALGLELVARRPADALTAIYAPEGLSSKNIVREMRARFGITISGGQGKLKDMIFRIAHLGYYDFYDTLAAINCLELTLALVGHRPEPGAAARAAQQVYLDMKI